MKYNFDEIINRENTDSIKYDLSMGKVPFWVADMDFKAPTEVLDDLVERARHGIFGYTSYSDSLKEATIKWFKEKHGVTYDPSWLCYTPGIVTAISFLIEALTDPGDAIVIQQPVYHPFTNQIVNNKRKMISSDLENNYGHYTINFQDLEAKLSQPEVKGMILCSPHNPIGRVWSKVELRIIVDIAKAYGKWIICDEIHCDLTRTGVVHTPILAIAEDYKDNIIVCTAPSKTFNIAGFQLSNIVIPNEEIRNKFNEVAVSRFELANPNSMSLVAARSAYEKGSEWLEELKTYLDGNVEFATHFFLENLPESTVSPCEGTYLLWVDLSPYIGTKWDSIEDMMNKTGLMFNDGAMFGPQGKNHIRINLACPRQILCDGLKKII